MKTSAPFLSLTSFALATVTLAGCSGGDDVYVRETNRTESSPSALACEVSAGADMCSRDIAVEPASERARVVDALQALSDFGASSERSLVALADACRSIALETTANLPYVPLQATPEQIATSVCGAAADAIVAGAGQHTLEITITGPSCSAAPRASCTAPRLLPSPVCQPPLVTVVPTANAPFEAHRVGDALSRHLGKVLAFKTELEAMAEATSTITMSTDTYARLPEGCATSAAMLVTKSTQRVNAVVSARNLLVNAAHWVSVPPSNVTP